MSHLVLENIAVQQIINVFDLLPDILFWIKDPQSRIVYANTHFLEHVGGHKLDDIRGKDDTVFSPKHLAHQFISDDKKILAGEVITNRLELNLPHNGEVSWFSTSKRPLLDLTGNIIGTYGVTRHFEKSFREMAHVNALKAPVVYIQENLDKTINIGDLAKVSHLSVSALERRFKKHLGKTPKQFINDARLTQARKLLTETNLPIGQVAYQTGFNEPSYFSKQFQKLFGCLPTEFRQQISSF